MKHLFFLVFIVFTTVTHAANFEVFLSSIEGDWKLQHEVTEVTSPTGEVLEVSTMTKFNATITREPYGWSLWEEYCVKTLTGEECGDMWAIYIVDGEKLFFVTEAGKREVSVLEDLPTRLVFKLGGAISHTESLSEDLVLQKNIGVDETGSVMTQSLFLERLKTFNAD